MMAGPLIHQTEKPESECHSIVDDLDCWFGSVSGLVFHLPLRKPGFKSPKDAPALSRAPFGLNIYIYICSYLFILWGFPWSQTRVRKGQRSNQPESAQGEDCPLRPASTSVTREIADYPQMCIAAAGGSGRKSGMEKGKWRAAAPLTSMSASANQTPIPKTNPWLQYH